MSGKLRMIHLDFEEVASSTEANAKRKLSK
jgi:hypothetical protein